MNETSVIFVHGTYILSVWALLASAPADYLLPASFCDRVRQRLITSKTKLFPRLWYDLISEYTSTKALLLINSAEYNSYRAFTEYKSHHLWKLWMILATELTSESLLWGCGHLYIRTCKGVGIGVI